MPVDPRQPYDDDNIFAKILRGDLPCNKVYEDDYALAFHDINPQAPVHILVIPKRRYVGFDDFAAEASAEEAAGFWRAVNNVARQEGLVDKGWRMLANIGHDAHQDVPHFHVHICAGRPLGRMIVPFDD